MSLTKPLLKQQKRSILGITRDILQACMDAGIEGILASGISRKANLSYNAVIQNCKELIRAGLIKSIRMERCYIFVITEKGIVFFQEFQKFQDAIKELNIRY
jgi:predicted transcriptional regulator